MTPTPADVPADAPPGCPNCATPFAPLAAPPRYCPTCGQASALYPPPLRERLREFMAHDVARPLRTLGLLVARPGRLTQEYIAGRRQRYLAPRQLFLASAFVFFLAVKLLPALQVGEPPARLAQAGAQAAQQASQQASEQASEQEAAAASNADAAVRPLIEAARRAASQASEAFPSDDELGLTINIGGKAAAGGASGPGRRRQGPFVTAGACADAAAGAEAQSCNWLERRALQAGAAWEKDPARAKRDFLDRTYAAAPYAVFLMLPIFAMLVKLFYWRRHLRFADHLVFGMHLHSLWFIAALAAALGPGTSWRDTILVAVMLYGLLAMRRVYAAGWIATALRAIAISFLYLFALSIGAALLTVGAALA